MKAVDLEVWVGRHRLVAGILGDIVPGRPTLLFLHRGLDCIALWRGLLEAVAAATSCRRRSTSAGTMVVRAR